MDCTKVFYAFPMRTLIFTLARRSTRLTVGRVVAQSRRATVGPGDTALLYVRLSGLETLRFNNKNLKKNQNKKRKHHHELHRILQQRIKLERRWFKCSSIHVYIYYSSIRIFNE